MISLITPEKFEKLGIEFLPRKCWNENKIQQLMESIENYGFIGCVYVASLKGSKFLADGNHRVQAAIRLNEPFNVYLDDEPKTLEQIIEIQANLNNTQKSWSIDEYAYAYGKVNKDYKFIFERTRVSRLSTSNLVLIYSNDRNNNRFRSGKWTISPSKDYGLKVEEQVYDVLKYLRVSRHGMTSLICDIIKQQWYNHDHLMSRLRSVNYDKDIPQNRKEARDYLLSLYSKRAIRKAA